MSIFGTIMSKIFHHPDAAPAGADASPQPSAGAAPENSARPTTSASSASHADPEATTTPDPEARTKVATNDDQPAGTATATTTPAATPSAPVDVAAVLNGLAAKNSQHLDWKHSIVDMMKLLDMDSSLTARKSLAEELHYTGDTGDSASMNIWLHKQVMQKLADNGGQVPADLKG